MAELKKRKKKLEILIREFDPIKDRAGVEDVERRCEVGSTKNKKLTLFTDLLGDPICRVRHSPAFLMLVKLFPLLILILKLNKNTQTSRSFRSQKLMPTRRLSA